MKKRNRITKAELLKSFRKQKQLWIISFIALAWLAVFAYAPMLGNIIAFFDYSPGKSLFDCEFIGIKYWIDFFKLPDMPRIFRNTLVMSGLNMTVGFVAPIIFALLLNEIHHTMFKKVIQTISYLPYFISWVVVASIMLTLLGTEGTINQLLLGLGITEKAISFLNEKDMFWGIITAANVWKDIGWSAIIYISAIAGVDSQLYEAGAVDGLGRFGKVWHITLPGIAPTIIMLFIMSIGGILNAGFEQQLLLGTPLTKEVYENIDTYVYRYGVQIGRYSFATSIGLFKSLIGFGLVMLANKISSKVTEMRLF